METINKPATPLPYHYGVGTENTPGGIGSKERAPLCKMTYAGLESAKDVAYLAHAANSYPKLVEMLKAAAPFVDYVANNGNLNAHGLHVEMLALLKEIGEAS